MQGLVTLVEIVTNQTFQLSDWSIYDKVCVVQRSKMLGGGDAEVTWPWCSLFIA